MATLARRLGVAGCGEHWSSDSLNALSPPRSARAGDVTFVVPGSGAGDALGSGASVVLSSTQLADRRTLRVADVALACARAHAWLPVRRSRASARGRIDPAARISAHATVEPGAVVGSDSVVDSGAHIAAGAMIGDHCSIGAGSIVHGNVTIGNRVDVGAATVLGADGFAFVREGRQWLQVPSFGAVVIDDDTTLCSQVCVHAGVFSDTRIGRRCALDSQVLVGHDVVIGEDTAIAGQTAIAGGARIGVGCRIGGKVGISEGVSIASDVTVTAMSMVIRSLPSAGSSYSSGWPAEESRKWWRRVVATGRRAATQRQGQDHG